MSQSPYKRIIELVIEANDIARSIGISNLLQPGLVKEIIIADILGHQVIPGKRDADARDPNNPMILYEYLSFKEGGSGQFDRMFKAPKEKRNRSLRRITRNKQIFFAVFYAANQLKAKVIYRVDPQAVADEAERQLDASKNDISHVAFPEPWVRQHGEVVYRDPDTHS